MYYTVPHQPLWNTPPQQHWTSGALDSGPRARTCRAVGANTSIMYGSCQRPVSLCGPNASPHLCPSTPPHITAPPAETTAPEEALERVKAIDQSVEQMSEQMARKIQRLEQSLDTLRDTAVQKQHLDTVSDRLLQSFKLGEERRSSEVEELLTRAGGRRKTSADSRVSSEEAAQSFSPKGLCSASKWTTARARGGALCHKFGANFLCAICSVF